MAQSLFRVLDHLVYATPDLHATVQRLESEIGVRATAGGRHPVWGTMNALLSLGSRVYLEIIGPDPDQPRPSTGRLFDLDRLARPCLMTWVARAENLQATVATAKAEGIDLGGIEARSRQRPDGSLLHWEMTDPCKGREGGIVPYFINWGTTAHPAKTAAQGCTLKALKAMHPEAERLRNVLLRLGLDLMVEQGPGAGLVATIETPKGDYDLS
jgi:glyoxalase-like protein